MVHKNYIKYHIFDINIVNLTVFMTNVFDWNTRNPVEETRDIWYRVTSNVTPYTRTN